MSLRKSQASTGANADITGLRGATRFIPPAGAAVACGDSITLGIAATTTPLSYMGLIGADTGWSITNNGIGGQEMSDIAAVQVYPTTTASRGRYTLLTGYNDMRHNGTTAVGQETYRRALRASLLWLALPAARKLSAQDAAITYAGTWTNTSRYSGAIAGKTSTAQNATATVTLYGTAIYLGFASRFHAANGATFTLTVDGVVFETVSTNVGVDPGNQAAFTWPEAVRIGGLPAGPHTVVVTVTSASGTLDLDWFGSNGGAGDLDAPWVFAGNTLRMNATGYASGSTNSLFNNGSNLAVGQYNEIHRELCRALAGDGLHVVAVYAAAAYNPDVAANISADNVHPSDAGHAQIAAAFMSRINGAAVTEPDKTFAGQKGTAAHAANSGDITINQEHCSVLFAGAATAVVLTNSYIRLNPRLSVLQCTIASNDATAANPKASITVDGQATIRLGTAPTGLCRVFVSIF